MDQRLKVGLIALVLLLIAGVLYVVPSTEASYQALQAACLKIGAIMAVLWLAIPEAGRLKNPWMIAACIGAVILIIVNRKLIIPALGIFALIYILRPRQKTPRQRP